MREFELALGQYQTYKALLEVIEPGYDVYLAVGKDTYATFFAQQAVQLLVQRFDVSVLVVDIAKEEVVQWIE